MTRTVVYQIPRKTVEKFDAKQFKKDVAALKAKGEICEGYDRPVYPYEAWRKLEVKYGEARVNRAMG